VKKLQSIVFPSTELPGADDLYFRGFQQGVIAQLAKGFIHIPARATVRSDTFFNGFSVGKWKKICQIDDLCIAIFGRGRVLVRIGLNVHGRPRRWLHEEECSLSETASVIEITAFQLLNEGILFFDIIALEDAVLTAGYFYTRTQPQNEVNLGIVVVHFNRKDYVLGTIRRITSQLLQHPEFDGRISLIVIDNSCNI
jgi:hypothetical protein